MQNSVVQWLEETSRRFPDRTAVTDEHVCYTWREVWQKAASVAQQLETAAPGSKQPVAVFMDKSADMVIAFLGVALSGNFYSPITPDMPRMRVEKILEVLQPAACVASRELLDEIGPDKRLSFAGPILCYEDISSHAAEESATEKLVSRVLDMDLLFVLFTSGSTGVPKGVANTHRAIMNHIRWFADEFKITEEDSFGNQSPLYFDNSNLDIYTAVLTGAALHIVPPDLYAAPVKLLQYLSEHKVTTLFWVPSAMTKVSQSHAFDLVDLSGTLKRAIFCGEAMPNKQLNRWRRALPDVLYANFYGPTEISVACTYYVVDRDFADQEPLPAGHPIPGYDVMVLDSDNKRVTKPETPGELCVRSTSVAVGYYNNPEKTAEAFVQNPLQTAYEEKIYRTGDIVKYNERGEIMFLSRKDFQIKHLGHRIELGEIETAVASLEGVGACCCLYNRKQSLIVLFLDVQFTRAEINEKLADLLPRYMLPSKVICLEHMPLNANGKIDRVRLREEYIDR